jgi:hypothetical protein
MNIKIIDIESVVTATPVAATAHQVAIAEAIGQTKAPLVYQDGVDEDYCPTYRVITAHHVIDLAVRLKWPRIEVNLLTKELADKYKSIA